MYNRYLHPNAAAYQPIPEEEAARASAPPNTQGTHADRSGGILQHFLNQSHLDQIDNGDLLLLALLYLLSRQNADEDLLIALGLLLIL